MSHTARIWTQDQLTEALASACVLEGVSILHRIENELNADEPTDEEIETCARGFFEGTPGPTNWDAVSEVSKQAWLHAAKKALAAVNAMKTKEES